MVSCFCNLNYNFISDCHKKLRKTWSGAILNAGPAQLKAPEEKSANQLINLFLIKIHVDPIRGLEDIIGGRGTASSRPWIWMESRISACGGAMEYISLLGANFGHLALNAINNTTNYLMNNPIVPIMVILGFLGLVWIISKA
jgi:hypothetical protein